jgi:hypothetical protein
MKSSISASSGARNAWAALLINLVKRYPDTVERLAAL